MQENLKLLKKVQNQFEAHAIRGFLASHDIECYIPDEMTISAHGQLQQVFGNFRLMVHASDLENARAILKDMEHNEG